MAEETDVHGPGSANFSEPFALGHVVGQPMAPQTLPDELPQAVDEGVLGQSAEAFGEAAAATMGLVCFLDYPDHDPVTSLRDNPG